MELSQTGHDPLLLRSVKWLVPSAKGKGLNSIPIRFALMVAIFAGVVVYLQNHFLSAGDANDLSLGITALLVIVPAVITFCMANRLTRAIRNLHKSTTLLVEGNFNAPVDVNCACEVGDLADSFRLMVKRINSNITRMNVLAYIDQTTNLPNRAVMNHALRVFVEHNRDGSARGALLFIDLDDFKHVNDTLGHEAGDELLRQVSHRIIAEGLGVDRSGLDDCMMEFGELCTKSPQGMVLSRFGGDEFMLFVPHENDLERIESHVRQILSSLGQPFTIFGHKHRLGASIGVARLGIDTGEPEQLVKYADIAMYAAKMAGKNRYHFFDPALEQAAIERGQMAADLRKAVETGEGLFLAFQPKVNATTLELEGVEALARWRHPKLGMIPPAKFIRIAEQCGLMLALGGRIMRLAMGQAVAWRDAGNPIHVFVNVSVIQFSEPTLVSDLLALFDEYGLEPSRVGIEVTESMVTSDFESAKEKMTQLQKAGVLIAIDDFGTGYSNISQVVQLPHDVLKIDKSLVDTIGVNAKLDSILSVIVYAAHALGHKVVAEGVETEAQQVFLTKVGCDQLQGYLLGRPMPAHELPAWQAQRGAPAAQEAAATA